LYCAFYSEPAPGELVDRYVAALSREMEQVAAELKPRTVFFGGGTPSLLSAAQWTRLLEAMARLDLLGAAEWTVECNPATVSLNKARLLRSFGVKRVSLGVQSFDDGLLCRLGRIHTRDEIFASFDLLRRAGFENLNLDLMFAIPGQTMATWRATLTEAMALQPEHLSCYEVIYEEDTPLFAQLAAGRLDVNEERACDQYEELLAWADRHGFAQYEIANFAKRLEGDAAGEVPRLACQHNVNYWRGGSFHGLGPSATSYVNGIRTRNITSTARYCERWEQGQSAIESSEQLSPLARAGETAAFGLRMTAGWPFEQFQQVTGFDLRDEWQAEMQELVARGWGHWEEHRFRLAPQGLRFADAAAELFLRPG
jgi:oxygen-independent coproporphyrinogen-3 oxidase